MDHNAQRLMHVEEAGNVLIQIGNDSDTARIQRELDNFRTLVDGIITRLNQIQSRLQKISLGEVSSSLCIFSFCHWLAYIGVSCFVSVPLGKKKTVTYKWVVVEFYHGTKNTPKIKFLHVCFILIKTFIFVLTTKA